MHMERIWLKALNDKMQEKTLVQKRRHICTVMQNKFAGKYSAIPGDLEKQFQPNVLKIRNIYVNFV
jgi:hypothetical protein